MKKTHPPCCPGGPQKGNLHMKRWTFIALTAATLLGLTACATSTPPSANAMNDSSLNKTLQAFHWELEKADDPSGRALPAFTALAPQRVVRLSFVPGDKPGDQRVVVDRLCNGIGAGYQLNGIDITISRPVSTMMACPDPQLMQLERPSQRRSAAPPACTWPRTPTRRACCCSSTTAAAGTWWASPPTPRVTAARAKPCSWKWAPSSACSHGVVRNAQCMQVREVKYNSAGLKTGTGEWGHFYGNIEGFTHQAGTRNVLRVKRYTIQNPPADASRYAYVLDMRVESELVGPR